MDRTAVFLLPEQLLPVLSDDVESALDRAGGMTHVAVCRQEQRDLLRVHLAPQRAESRTDLLDRALVARSTTVRLQAFAGWHRRPRRRWRRGRGRRPGRRERR